MHCNGVVMVFACWKVHFPSVNVLNAGAILAGLVFNEIICRNIYWAWQWGLTPLAGTVREPFPACLMFRSHQNIDRNILFYLLGRVFLVSSVKGNRRSSVLGYLFFGHSKVWSVGPGYFTALWSQTPVCAVKLGPELGGLGEGTGK